MGFPCKNCKDRTVQPNCHTSCAKYIQAQEEQKEIRSKKAKDAIDYALLEQSKQGHHNRIMGRYYKIDDD